MGWTKRQFIEQAFEEIGLAAYVFDLTPEQLQSALRRLDAMMAGWNTNGIRIGWPMPFQSALKPVPSQRFANFSGWSRSDIAMRATLTH